MRKLSTFGLRTDRLANLLAMASQGGQSADQSEEVLAWRKLLHARLSAPLCLEEDVVDSVPALLDPRCRELAALVGRSLEELLTDAGTSLATLECLKDYGKALAGRWEEGPEHAVGTSIYYAAVAAALAHHDRNLASRPLRELGRAMDLLIAAPWMTAPMVKLLSNARRLCPES